jgi:hypothetical protein
MTEMLLGSLWLGRALPMVAALGIADELSAARAPSRTRRGSRREPRHAIALHARAGERPSSPTPTGDDQS